MTKSLLDSERTVVQAEGYIVSQMEGDTVMMSVQSGKYYNLGPIGGRIWELIASPVSIGQVVDVLTAEYDIDRTACEEQAGAFLRSLHEEGLIRVEEAAQLV